MDRALGALPEIDELIPLRDALIGGARRDSDREWTGSDEYSTLDTRLADPVGLEERLEELAERVRERTERLFRHSLAALRALEDSDEATAARELIAAGEIEEAERRFEQAEQFFSKALELGRKPRDRSGEGLALRRLARVARSTGELDRARKLYRAGFEVAEAMADVEGMVVACQGLGNVGVDQGLWEEALRWYTRGLDLLGTDTPSRTLWLFYVNMAAMELRLGNEDRCAALLAQAEAIVRILGDAHGEAYLANGEGRLHVARGEFAAAEAAYRRGLSSITDPAQRAILLVNLTEALRLQERLSEAEEVARQLEEVVLTHRITPFFADVYRALGAVAHARRDPEAFIFYEQALTRCREHDLPRIELALTEYEYAQFEAEHRSWESARARLHVARHIYEQLGARAELERVNTEIRRVAARAGPVNDSDIDHLTEE